MNKKVRKLLLDEFKVWDEKRIEAHNNRILWSRQENLAFIMCDIINLRLHKEEGEE